jgi:cytochrome c oxidase cbb3-type subunit III
VFRADDLIQKKEFENEMAAAQASRPPTVAEFQITLLTDAVFQWLQAKKPGLKICAVCHLVDGGGLVGPNMADNYWIHGNTLEDMFAIVTNGVIEKGMIPYKDQLSPKQRLEVISYIQKEIVGSTPANPKAPEGQLYN